jgi:uncharacterized membrane protein
MANGATGGTLFPVLKNEVRAVRTALWLRPAAFCSAAALAATLLATADVLLPQGSLGWLPEIDVEAVKELLKLLATGMLTVATVTLSVLMLVLSLAAGQVSPRAVPAVMADLVTQNALGTFLATFVFALAALLFIGFDVVSGPGGVALIFLGALLLALNAVRYMVQWTHHVAQILKINRMIDRIHGHGVEVLEAYLESAPGARCEALSVAEKDCTPLRPASAGYIQLIDAERLHHVACEEDLVVRVCVQEGDFVHPHARLMEVHGSRPRDEVLSALRGTAVIGFERNHEGDPRLAFVLLAEIACRALSPGINDPQSARSCVEYLGSLLAVAGSRPPGEYPPARSSDGRVQFVRPDFAAMLERAFRPIMRDGAAMAEVIIEILRVLRDLVANAAPDYLDCLLAEAQRAEEWGETSLQREADKHSLRSMAEDVRSTAAARRG